MELSDRTRFSLFAPEPFLREYGCSHDTEEEVAFWAATGTCRPCAVSMEAHALNGIGRLEMSVLDTRFHEEHRLPGQIITGSYDRGDDRASLCVSRMIAFLNGHPDPLELTGAR